MSGFCEGISSWKKAREEELSKLNEIKDKLELVTKNKGKRREELETDLTSVLEDTLQGLKKLDHFLEAVEKLAVTSLHVFTEENVQVVIITARLICPLLLKFKRDASVFFLPKLQNVEVLSDQLDKYIKNTWNIFEMMEKR